MYNNLYMYHYVDSVPQWLPSMASVNVFSFWHEIREALLWTNVADRDNWARDSSQLIIRKITCQGIIWVYPIVL